MTTSTAACNYTVSCIARATAMSAEKSISFRTHLLANTTDLIGEIDLHCSRTTKLISGIVSQLAAYAEEGVPLTPTVFICNSISKLLQRAGVGEYIPLSVDQRTEDAAEKILKVSAPLCRDNWMIYIQRSATGETCRFGVFCGSNDPSSLTLDEVVLDGFEVGFPIIRIAQSAINKVEVRTNRGSAVEFRFNDDVDATVLNTRSDIKTLSKMISRDVSNDGEQFSGFIERIIATAIKDSHGTLIAVTRPGVTNLPPKLTDAVSLTPHLDLYERFRRHLDEGKTATSVSRLQTAADLISGFIGSDGITVFSADGKVLCYRAFIQSEAVTSPSTGGARTRAFNAMTELLDDDLAAAFFRSQDGRTELRHRAEDVPNE